MPLWRVVWSELRIGEFETEAADATGAQRNWYAAKEADRRPGRVGVAVHSVERVHPRQATSGRSAAAPPAASRSR